MLRTKKLKHSNPSSYLSGALQSIIEAAGRRRFGLLGFKQQVTIKIFYGALHGLVNENKSS